MNSMNCAFVLLYPDTFCFTIASSTHVSSLSSQPQFPSLKPAFSLASSPYNCFKALLLPYSHLFLQPGSPFPRAVPFPTLPPDGLSFPLLPGLTAASGFPQPPCLNPRDSRRTRRDALCCSIQLGGSRHCLQHPNRVISGKGQAACQLELDLCTQEPLQVFTSGKSPLMCKLQFSNLIIFRHVYRRTARGNFLLQTPFPTPLHLVTSKSCPKSLGGRKEKGFERASLFITWVISSFCRCISCYI